MLNTRTFADIISDNPWQRAYWVAVVLTGMNVALTLVIWGFGVEAHLVNGAAAASIALVGMYCGFRMIMAGALLGALPFFLIGSSIFYGAGAVIAAMHPDAMSLLSFTEDVQRSILAKVNLANALSIFIILLSAGPLCAAMTPQARNQPGLLGVVGSLESSLTTLMIVSFGITFLLWINFPSPGSALLATLLGLLRGIPLFAILLGAALWDRLQGPMKLMIIIMVMSHAFFGMLGFVKVLTLLPVLVLVLGWWLNGKMARAGLVLTIVIGVAYFAFFAELMAIGRLHTNYDPLLNTAGERLWICLLYTSPSPRDS